jgi:hypothetical protein
MNSPKKEIPLLFIFLAALALRLLLGFLSPSKHIAAEDQTFMFAVVLGITGSIAQVLALVWSSKSFPQHLLEIFVLSLGFLIAGRVENVWYWESPVLYGFVSVLVNLGIIIGVYQLLVWKIRSKNESEEQPK